MAHLPIRIIGTAGDDGELIEAHVHKHHGGKHAGIVALTDPLIEFIPETHSFLNDIYGSAMNQNISFGGTPEIIHNGGTSVEWTGAAVQGTWDFADAGKVSLTNGDNNDAAIFSEETPTTIDLSGYTTLTGKINLTTYSTVNNTLTIIFDNIGAAVGISVNIDDYIDTGLIGTEQSFVIPKADMGLTTQLVDGFNIALSRVGGTKPTMTFDDIQLEETGASATFLYSPPAEKIFHVDLVRFSIIDNTTGITSVSGATENATMAGLSYNTILGVSALTNGIIYQRIQESVVQSSDVIRQLGDFLAIGANISGVPISDGTNTCLTLDIHYPRPIILEGNENILSLTISDNLSGLISFTAAVRGAVEI